MISGVSGLSDRMVSVAVPGRSGEPDLSRLPAERSPVIDALVTLLCRESKTSNLSIIRSRLIEAGPSALPCLDLVAASAAPNESDAARVVALEIRRRLLDAEWDRWMDRSDADLETGALLIDRFGDPVRDSSRVSRGIDELAFELERRLTHASDTGHIISTMTAYLFDEVGLQGNTEWYDDPDNSYLSRVLERKLGIPVSLSVVMLLIADRLELPLVGIGMPGHFIVRYGGRVGGPYLDPFSGGKILTQGECADWLRSSGFEFHPRMLRPVNSRRIIARMLRNLIAHYSQHGAVFETAVLSGYLKRVLASSDSAETSAGSDPSAQSAAG